MNGTIENRILLFDNNCMASLRRNTYFISAGQVLRLFLALLMYPVATRYLGDADFGRYSLATTIMFIVFLFNDFGINTLMVREVAKDKEKAKEFYGNAITLKIMLTVVSALFIVIYSVVTDYENRTYMAIYIFAVYGILSSFVQLTSSVFRAYERMEFDALVVILEKTLITVFGVGVLLLGYGLKIFSWVFVLCGLISFVLGLVIVSKRFFVPRLHFQFDQIKSILIGSFFFGVSLFLSQIYNRVGVIMLSIMKTDQVVGWYAAAFKLLAFTNIIPMIFVTSFFPRMSINSRTSNEELSKVFSLGFRFLVILALPLAPAVALLADKIILLMSGSQFVNSIPALRILGVAASVLFINIFLASLYGATNNQKRLVGMQVIGLLVNVTANLVLIPRFAHIGASYATIITEVSICVAVLGYALLKIVRLDTINFIPKALLATLIMAGLIKLTDQAHLLVQVLLAVVSYFGIIILTKAIKTRELVDLKRFKSLAFR